MMRGGWGLVARLHERAPEGCRGESLYLQGVRRRAQTLTLRSRASIIFEACLATDAGLGTTGPPHTSTYILISLFVIQLVARMSQEWN